MMILQNRYETERILGRGGFGITSLAMDRKLNQLVVIKEFAPYPAAKADKRAFLQEARRLSRLFETEGIVKVLDFFEENQTAYIVMEYVRGIPLDQYLERQDVPMSFREAWEFLGPVRQALKAVHRKGLIHRDVNPANIMVTEEERLKLIDFGAARYYSGNEKTMTILVKRGYAPPEQYGKRSRQGPWTDVYAFCATLYEMVTGVRPDPSIERMEEDLLYPPSAYGVEISRDEEVTLRSGMELEVRKRIRRIAELEAGMLLRKDVQGEEAAEVLALRKKCGTFSAGGVLRRAETFSVGGVLRRKRIFLAVIVLLAAAGFAASRRMRKEGSAGIVYAGNYGRGTEEYEQFVRFVQEHAVSSEAKEPEYEYLADEVGSVVYTLPEKAVLEWNEPCNALRFFKKREELSDALRESGCRLTKTEETSEYTTEIRKYGAILTNFVRTEYYRTDTGCCVRIKSDRVNDDILHVRIWRETEDAPLQALAEEIAEVLSANWQVGETAYFFYPYSTCLEYYWP